MAEQTLVAVYDSASHADAAVQALRAANVPADAINQHASATGGSATTAHESGFWSSLFGGDTADAHALGRSVAGGSTVVTVRVSEQHVARVSEILEAHDPIDFDERSAGYGASQTTTASAVGAATAGTSGDTLNVVEERLVVGKRVVNKGGARVRSYVVETPVEQQVTLHDETVRVERHPVTDGRPATAADFQERTLEVQTRSEEAVVGKEARVVEEVGLRKEATDRVETVRDTVRRTEVDVENPIRTTTDASAKGTTGSNPPGTAASRAVDNALGTNVSGANPTRK